MAQTIEVTTPGVLDLFRPIHQRIRESLEGLDSAALNWRPGRETNSIGAVIQHIAATEQGNLARVIGTPGGSFAWDENRRFERGELLHTLDKADAFLDEMAAAIPSSSLAKEVVHPHRGPSSALVLLLQTYGHVTEHYGHLTLTRQLYFQSFPSSR
ncbi:MAG: DUF664 domain-containing protein [Chloroflexi bacterium]|nr:DUF664 domain-containing protein [Chloroflexota bacterium]